jgi:hypothetical protein
MGRLIAFNMMRDVRQDQAVLEHKRHLARPGLLRRGRPDPAFRRWARQFYPDGRDGDARRATWSAAARRRDRLGPPCNRPPFGAPTKRRRSRPPGSARPPPTGSSWPSRGRRRTPTPRGARRALAIIEVGQFSPPQAAPHVPAADLARLLDGQAQWFAREAARLEAQVAATRRPTASAGEPEAVLGPGPRPVPSALCFAELARGPWVWLRWLLFPPATMGVGFRDRRRGDGLGARRRGPRGGAAGGALGPRPRPRHGAHRAAFARRGRHGAAADAALRVDPQQERPRCSPRAGGT